MKAVNRGQTLESRSEAVLAVGVARQQKRFWSRSWLLGPVVALLFSGQGAAAYLANALAAALIMGGMSWFWYRRAGRSEAANLAHLGIHPDAATSTVAASGPEDDADEPDRAGTPHAANPPKRSRAQRRKRR